MLPYFTVRHKIMTSLSKFVHSVENAVSNHSHFYARKSFDAFIYDRKISKPAPASK